MTRKERASIWISNVLNPMPVAVVVFAVIVFGHTDISLPKRILFFSITSVCTSIFPFLFLYSLKRRGRIKSIDIDLREKRVLPLFLGGLNFLAGFLLLKWLGAPNLVTGLMFCYGTNTIILVLITRYWKVSLHASGVAGPITGLFLMFGMTASPCFALIPLVSVSRVILKKHTPMQVTIGSILGVGLTAFQLQQFFL